MGDKLFKISTIRNYVSNCAIWYKSAKKSFKKLTLIFGQVTELLFFNILFFICSHIALAFFYLKV